MPGLINPEASKWLCEAEHQSGYYAQSLRSLYIRIKCFERLITERMQQTRQDSVTVDSNLTLDFIAAHPYRVGQQILDKILNTV